MADMETHISTTTTTTIHIVLHFDGVLFTTTYFYYKAKS